MHIYTHSCLNEKGKTFFSSMWGHKMLKLSSSPGILACIRAWIWPHLLKQPRENESLELRWKYGSLVTSAREEAKPSKCLISCSCAPFCTFSTTKWNGYFISLESIGMFLIFVYLWYIILVKFLILTKAKTAMQTHLKKFFFFPSRERSGLPYLL